MENQQITHDTLFEPVETSENLSNESGQTLDPKIVSPAKVEEVPVETSSDNVEELPKGDKPKSEFDPNHFQKIADQRLTELTKIKLEKEKMEAELNQLKNPAPEPRKILTKPIRPKDYNDLDALTEGTSSWQYKQDKEAYAEQQIEIIEELKSTLAKEKEQIARMNQVAQAKANALGLYTAQGKSIEEANKIYDWTAKLFTEEGFTPERVIRLYELENGSPSATNQLKSTQMDQRNEKSKMVIPPGVIPTETQKKTDPDEQFNAQFKKSESRTI